jgi:hypothetical protein
VKRLGYVVFLIIVVLSSLAGYWPQHRKWVRTQAKLADTSAKLSNAELTLQLCQLQGQLVALIQETEEKNYSDASALSTKFFDGLRAEAESLHPSSLQSSLQSILSQRDEATAALARADPKAHDLLVKLLGEFSKSIATNLPSSQSSD